MTKKFSTKFPFEMQIDPMFLTDPEGYRNYWNGINPDMHVSPERSQQILKEIMSSIQLTPEEQQWLEWVYRFPGSKTSSNAPWERLEILGLVRAVGSYKFEVVPERVQLVSSFEKQTLTCSLCGIATSDPWHYSTATSKHEHACDACWPKVSKSLSTEFAQWTGLAENGIINFGDVHVTTDFGRGALWADEQLRKKNSTSIASSAANKTLKGTQTKNYDHTIRAAVSAVNTLEFLGYTYKGGEKWKPPLGPKLVDTGPWKAGIDVSSNKPQRVYLQSLDFNHDVRLYVDGNFATPEHRLDYARRLAEQFNGTFFLKDSSKEPWFSDKEVQDYLSYVRNSSALHPVPPYPPMPFRYAQISSHDVYTFSQVQRLLSLFTDAMFVFRDSLKKQQSTSEYPQCATCSRSNASGESTPACRSACGPDAAFWTPKTSNGNTDDRN